MRGGDDELERFKRDVNLVELASSYGYVLVRKESGTTCKVMKNEASASKIIVATAPDGHSVFFEVHGDASGSVIDFVKYRENCNLGQARVKLREYTGHPRLNFPISSRDFVKPAPAARDRIGNAVRWQKAQPYNGGYLESRGLTPETIAHFSEHIRIIASLDGKHRNVAFRHDDAQGVTGWEMKNKGFTGFAVGGGKALFVCQVGETGPPSRIVICESAIDAMSYCQLSKKPGLYVSFAGGLSEEQKTMLRKLLTGNPQARVIAATDADRDGEKYALFVHSIREDAIRARPEVRRQPGVMYKDWNDVLMNRPAPPQAAPQQSQQTEHGREPEAAHEVAPSVTPVSWGNRGRSAIPPAGIK